MGDFGKRQPELRSLPQGGVYPDPTVMKLHDTKWRPLILPTDTDGRTRTISSSTLRQGDDTVIASCDAEHFEPDISSKGLAHRRSAMTELVLLLLCGRAHVSRSPPYAGEAGLVGPLENRTGM
jgi:hypothetical protein